MHYPLDTLEVTQPFGARPEYYKQFGLNGHEGVDFRTKNGVPKTTFWNDFMGYRPVYAVTDGICVAHYGHRYYGTYIDLVDVFGNFYRYAHLKNARPPSPQNTIPSKDFRFILREGDIIGVSGRSGNASQAHLHFMYRPAKHNVNNGYFGYEDPIKVLFPAEVTVGIARIGLKLPPGEELQAQVAKFTNGQLSLRYGDYIAFGEVPSNMLTQDMAYRLVDLVNPKETFVQIYYESLNAPFAASYSYPAKKKFISTLPNNPPANIIAYELSHCLQFYCNDVLKAGIQIEDTNFPNDAYIRRKYGSVDSYLNKIK